MGGGHKEMMILAGDIGGTKTNIAVFAVKKGLLHRVAMETYASREHPGLSEIVEKFLAAHDERVSRACFGIAGPVKQGRSQTTNLAWTVDSAQLAHQLGLERVGLLNDLEATAWGIAALEPADLAVINPGLPDPQGNAAVIAAGTGLGEAGLEWNGTAHWPFASEGGHCDFAPRNDLEIDLLRYLSGQFGHVSYERVLSGPGLHNVYRFFRDTRRAEEPSWLAEELAQEDPAAVISQVALERRAAICEQSLDLFVRAYAGEAGNLALKTMATGGVYLAGGIAPKIAEWLIGPVFLHEFAAKGRLQALLEQVPVKIIVNQLVGLLGAARWTLYHPPPARRRSTHRP